MHYNGMGVDQYERDRLDVVLASPGPATVKDAKGRETRIPMGAIHRWVFRIRQTLADANIDVSAIVSRNAKKDREASEWIESLELEEREEADIDAEDAYAAPGAMPTARELGLDVLAFNPASHDQLRAVLFEEWNLPRPTDLKDKELYTSAGEISTGDAVMRRLMINGALTPHQVAFIHAVRMMRRHAKVWGTYVRPMRLPTGDVLLDRGCRVWSDGRLHATWRARGAVTGRFSSQGPNCQNQPTLAKGMIVAAPGNVLVSADADQIELRIAASRWGAARYLEAFAKGIDPHQMTMEAVFGRPKMMSFQGAPSKFGAKDFGKGSEFEKMRVLAKQIQYASQYAAGCALRSGSIEVVDVSSVFRLVTSAEDKKKGVLLFPDLTEIEVGAMHDNWLKGCPEFPEGWLREARLVRAQGYLSEPVTGRRRDFTGARAAKLNEFVNFPIQGSASGFMNQVLIEAVEAIPFQAWGPGTGLINQKHDEITFECPIPAATHVEDTLNRLMNRRIPAYPDIDFSSKATIAWPDKDPMGRGMSRWSEV
jgi:hypothetical protein